MNYKLIIGVDISKKTLDVTGIKSLQKSFPHDSFLNEEIGFRSFQKWMTDFTVESDGILVCMEHTGFYMISFCNFLQNIGIDYSVVNPLQIKRSMGIQRVKTDKRDSAIIALYASKFTEDLPIGQIPKNELLQLKVLAAHRERLLKQKQAIEKINKELIHTLDEKLIAVIIKDNLAFLKLLKDRFKKIEKSISMLIADIPIFHFNYELMKSIPGVGPQIALYVLLFTHNFDRIKDPRKFGSFSGVVPNSRRSGTSIKGRDRVSPYANKKMKSLLNFGALTAIKFDYELKEYYNRKVKEGKSKMSVINAVRNKLVHRIYGVVKRGTPYINRPVFISEEKLVLS